MRIRIAPHFLLLLGLLVAGCSPGSGTPTPSDEATNNASTTGDESATVLRFAVSEFDQLRYDSLIAAFEADNPGVDIKTVSVEATLGTRGPGEAWPDDAYLQLAAAADVIGATATRAAVQQGALLDLSSLIASDPNITADSFYPGLLEGVSWDGGIWSLPAEASYSLISYNKALFDAAGVPYPQPGWTWTDLLNTALALTARDGDQTTQWGLVASGFDPVTLVQAYAGPVVDASSEPPKASFDSAAVSEAVRWLSDLYLVHNVTPYQTAARAGGGFGGPANSDAGFIGNNRAAMWLGSGGVGVFTVRAFGPGQEQGQGPAQGQGQGQGLGQRQGQQETGLVPMPVSSSNTQSTPAVITGFSISRGTQKADLAWRWISYLALQQARQQGVFRFEGGAGGTAVPAMPSVAAAAGYWDRLSEDSAAAIKYATEHAFVDNYNGVGYSSFEDALRAIIEDGTPVETALADAQTSATDEIEVAYAARPTPVANLAVAAEEEQALAAGAVRIQFGMAESPFGQESLQALVDQFQQEQPGIIVEVSSPPGFRGDLGSGDMAADFDCFQSSPNFSSESDLAGILSVDPFLQSDPSTSADDFYPSLLQQFTFQGQVWGLPGNATVSVITYNKDMFDAAGLPYPAVDWTTNDFLETAVALTKGEGDDKQYGYLPLSSAINDLVILLDRLGASPYDGSVDPPRLDFTNPDVVDAVRWYANLTTQFGVTPVVENGRGPGEGIPQAFGYITEGRVAMWTGGGFGGGFAGGFGRRGGFVINFEGGNQSELNTGIVPYPAGANGAAGSGFQNVTGYFISAQTTERQACWQWITFLTEQPNAGTGLPARIAVAESAAYRQQVGDETAAAYLASVSSGEKASFFEKLSNEAGWLTPSLNFLSDAYDQIVAGDQTVEAALDDAQVKMDAYRDCMIMSNALDDFSSIQTCLGQQG